MLVPHVLVERPADSDVTRVGGPPRVRGGLLWVTRPRSPLQARYSGPQNKVPHNYSYYPDTG